MIDGYEPTAEETAELLAWYRRGLLTIESTEAEIDRLRGELARFQEWSELRDTGVLQLRLELAEAIRHRDEARLVADEVAVEREEAWDALARVRKILRAANSFTEAYYSIAEAVKEDQS